MKKLMDKKIWIILLLLVCGIFPFISGQSSYYLTVFVMILVYVITAMSLDLLIGFGGQISVGHAGFLAIGSYAVALLTIHFHMPFIISIIAAGIIAGLLGFIIGLPAVRLSGQFLAVVTLGFGLSIPQILLYFDQFTGGYSGLTITRPTWMANKLVLFYIVLAITGLIIFMLQNIIHSCLGRVFVFIRDSELTAQATGV